jgi:hypothetical protein
MRKLKAKMQQKKSGIETPAPQAPAIPQQQQSQAQPPVQPAAFRITQSAYTAPQQPGPQPVQPPVHAPEITAEPIRQEISLPPPPPEQPLAQQTHRPPVNNRPMAEPTIERIEDDTPVVSFEAPEPYKKEPVPPPPSPQQQAQQVQAAQSYQSQVPPEGYMETIIRPVGHNVELPTDKMPEFRKQPAPPPGTNPQPNPAPLRQPPKKDEGEPPPPSKIKHNYW